MAQQNSGFIQRISACFARDLDTSQQIAVQKKKQQNRKWGRRNASVIM